MSVRDGLLAILSLGPAYGHQLHLEFAARAPHRGPVNVGQVYSTIDRLTRDKLVAPAGATVDSLPLYGLTDAGRIAADAWMSVPSGAPALDWSELLDQLVVTSTIDRGKADLLAAASAQAWSAELAAVRLRLETETESVRRIALLARKAHAVAVLAWLESYVDAIQQTDTELPYSADRPKRGRRPRAVGTVH